MTHRMKLLAGLLVAVTLTACASSQPAPEPPMDSKSQSQASMEVTGTVVYRERIALTPAAVLRVEVVEAGSESVVAEQTYANPGQVPLRFSVTVPGERIRPEGSYLLRARITDGSRSFSAAQGTPVLTQGAVSQDLQVLVRSGG